jgi:hypothetical protein
VRRASKVLGARVGGPRWLCRLLGLRLVRRSEKTVAAVHVVLNSGLAAAAG